MSVCRWCHKEMASLVYIDSCTGNTQIRFPDGLVLPAVPYTPDYGGPEQRCHDCGVSFGGFHHPGCDMERCPKCPEFVQKGITYKHQLISCGCLDPNEYTLDAACKTRCFVEEVMRDIFQQDLTEEETVKLCERIMETLPIHHIYNV